MLRYQTRSGYNSPTFPPENYPSASPYAALTRYFYKLIKAGVIGRRLLKNLLYSEYLNKFNLSLVKIRHHKTETSITIRDIHCRDSIIRCDSDSGSDSSDTDSSDSTNKFKRQNAVQRKSSYEGSSSSSNPFGYIRYYNPQTGAERQEVTKYESIIDYGEPSLRRQSSENKPKSVVHVSTANIHLHKQFSEESETSTNISTPKPYMACENLPNLKDSLELQTLPLPEDYMPIMRQSCPTKFVGNKFNESSLTTIYIPAWSNSENNIACKKSSLTLDESSCSTTTTHSSSLELPVNTLPLPDKVLGELLYNFDGEFTKSQSIDSDFTEHSSKTVIKPPTMFAKEEEKSVQSDIEVNPQKISLNLENIRFRKHSINSDKPKRRSSIQINPQDLSRNVCVSSQFIQLQSQPTTSRQSFCRCCSEYCQDRKSVV